MELTDLDKIVDKLLVFRGKIPPAFDGYHRECNQDLINRIDELIEFIDLYSRSGVI